MTESVSQVKEVVDKIIGEENELMVNISLQDLIWTIVSYSFNMRNIEDEIFKDYPFEPVTMRKIDVEKLIKDKEYFACRRDELARLISQFSDFDTRKIWVEVDKLFEEYHR